MSDSESCPRRGSLFSIRTAYRQLQHTSLGALQDGISNESAGLKNLDADQFALSWDNSVWNEGAGESNSDSRSSGVALSFAVADEFVVMRIAQLLEAGQLTEAVTRALEKWRGNGGCIALCVLGERLEQV